MTLPIVVIHKSKSDYLSYCLLQARRSNPNSRLILIGDGQNDCDAISDHHKLTDYQRGANWLASVYEHLSLSPYDFELFCIQRWFILEEFMVANGISSVFHQDTDVMLYGNVSAEQQKFTHCGLAYAGASGHSVFINSLDALHEFCAFIMQHYTNPSLLNGLRGIFENYKKYHSSGGISDMMFFHQYRRDHPEDVGNLFCVNDHATYDDNFNHAEGYESFCGKKRIYFRDDKVFCRQSATGQFILFNTLHFQGASKKLMKYAYERRVMAFRNWIIILFCLQWGQDLVVTVMRPLLHAARTFIRNRIMFL